MPPAGYWAAKGQMSFAVALVCGVLGSVIGRSPTITARSSSGGRDPALRQVRLSQRKNLLRSERFFAEHGEISTLIGRLFPVIRHLISIPRDCTGCRCQVHPLYRRGRRGVVRDSHVDRILPWPA